MFFIFGNIVFELPVLSFFSVQCMFKISSIEYYKMGHMGNIPFDLFKFVFQLLGLDMKTPTFKSESFSGVSLDKKCNRQPRLNQGKLSGYLYANV